MWPGDEAQALTSVAGLTGIDRQRLRFAQQPGGTEGVGQTRVQGGCSLAPLGKEPAPDMIRGLG